MKSVPLSEIAFDAGTQVRASINEQKVADYAELMGAGTVFPAVVLFHDGNRYYIGDGFHRGLAAKRNGLTEIPSDVRPGTRSDALWFAIGANKNHGLPLTEADKRHAIEMAYAEWLDNGQREIADQVGCSATYVGRIRQELQVSTGLHLPETVTGKDGKKYPSSRGPNAKSVQKRAHIAGLVRDGLSPSEIAEKVGVSFTTVAEVRREMGIPTTDKTRDGVAQRKKDIRDMAERGFTTRQIASSLSIHEETVSGIAKKEGIVIHADRVAGKTVKHDANRIVEQMVMDAENLTADVNLIDFSELDTARIGEWVQSLIASRKSLNSFIQRLTQEQKRNGEAA